jgi:hypothetical protein
MHGKTVNLDVQPSLASVIEVNAVNRCQDVMRDGSMPI